MYTDQTIVLVQLDIQNANGSQGDSKIMRDSGKR